MNFQRMRQIDKWIGVPLCFGLNLVRLLWNGISPKPLAEQEPQTPKKILFIKLIEQGSTILAYDALQRAVQLVGRQNVYFYVFQENKLPLEILNLIPDENIFSVRVKSLPSFVQDILVSLWRVRQNKIDTLIDLEFFARGSAILAYLTGIPRRVGLYRFTADAPYRGDLMTHRVQYNPYIHTSVYFRSLVEAALQSPTELPLLKTSLPAPTGPLPKFQPKEDELLNLRKKLDNLDPRIHHRRIVLFNANASDLLPLRKWPEDRYIELAKNLLERHSDIVILFTGAPSEKDSVEQIVRQISSDRVFNIAGLTTFRELFALYTLAEVLLTNDSGPGHFSSLTDVYAITLFGPETPLLYGALGENKISYSKQLACSPCVNVFNHRFSPCRNNLCMQLIRVEEVLSLIETGLSKKQNHRITA